MTVWEQHAAKWEQLGSPQKPSHADIQNHSFWISEYMRLHKNPLTVLLLGVTPELANLPWPHDTTLLAVDFNLVMINSILPKQTPTIKPAAVAGNWLQLPLADSSVDIVIGDGCYSTLAEGDYEKMTREIRRVLAAAGMFIMRFFTRPAVTESVEEVHKDFLSGAINSFHVLKWRLAMALHDSLKQGVCLQTIWDVWNQKFQHNRELMQTLQWSEPVINTINHYRNSDIFYTFPTLQEIRAALRQQFKELDIFIPDYALGERCPTITFGALA
jgi:SAM-dependent methyltransferase